MAKKKETKAKSKKESISVGGFFGRFHAVIFFVGVCGSLTVAVYMLSAVVAKSSTPSGYTPPSSAPSFDAETIERVEQLRTLDTPPAPLQLPADQRTDPFAQ